MEEVQRLCDRVAIMDHGKILAVDTVEGLIGKHGGSSLVKAQLASPPSPDLDLPGELDGTSLRIETGDPFEVVASLGSAGIEVSELHIERPDLEKVFLQLTGKSLRDQ